MAPANGSAPGCGEQMTGQVRTGAISGRTFTSTVVRFTDVGGRAFFEGDILLGPTRRITEGAGGRTERGSAIVGAKYRWPGGRVPYQIDGSLAEDDARVLGAIAHFREKTGLTFVERQPANRSQHPDYVLFGTFEDACWSSVGRQGGEQLLCVGSGCARGNVIHELAHTIGLWHEQSRKDRDQFVVINVANIDPRMLHNFDQHITDGDDVGAYDYQSIMHYPSGAFSANGQPTVVPTQPGAVIGQRDGLSAGDCQAIAAIYLEELARR